MSILLPTSPGPMSAEPAYIDYGGILRPVAGGPDQKLNRLGNRFALDVTMPPMDARDARVWVAALVQAQRSGAIFRWPAIEDRSCWPLGAFVVDGAGQAGLSLKLRGNVPNTAFVVGTFFSVIHNDRRYLHMVTAQAIAGADAKVTLPVEPMMRAPFADGAIVETVRPMIEGFLEGNTRSWTLDVIRNVCLSFKITEAQ